MTPEHTRDTGSATVRPDGACAVLFDRRSSSQPIDFPDRRGDYLAGGVLW